MAYKTHMCIRYTSISAEQIPSQPPNKQKSNQSANIKRDEINNLHNSLLNYDNRYMKVTLKSKLIGVAW